jgi:TonB-linked SusC/RagA family outer membrane protein
MNQFHFSVKFLTTIILLFLSYNMKAQAARYEASPGEKKITIVAKELPIKAIFKGITKQTGLRFSYNNNDINQNEKITAPFVDMAVDKVLKHIFAGRAISWSYMDNIVRIGKSPKDQGPSLIPPGAGGANNSADTIPTINVTGQVMDPNSRPIVGATVSLRGQGRGQGTDNNGYFSFSNIPSNAVLMISSIGYETKQISVSGQKSLRVSLDSMIREIRAVEVVSTGYQNIPRERATGSFVQISNKVYNEQVGTNIMDRLPAITSSLNTIPGRLTAGTSQFTVRGLSTITGPKNPLIIVDNFPYEGDLNNINPNDIENITVLRDAAAASIWGTRAGNGVIVITTKRGKFNERLKVDFNANFTTAEKPDLFYLKDISTRDFIEVEKYLFNKGYYNSNLDFNPTGFQTEVVDILERQRKNEITEQQANAMIEKIKGRDIRNEFNRYVYQHAANQQYSLNLRGGNNTMAWTASAGFDRNANELDAAFNRYNFRVENIYKPIESLQITAGITYSNTESGSGKTGYKQIPSVGIPPYTIFKDENGEQVPFSTYYRQKFLDTIGGGRLLDWGYYPLEDYKHSINNTKLQSIIARFGLKYTLFKGVSVDLNYGIEKQNTTNRILNDVESFFTRDLINLFSNVDYSTGKVNRAIPLGGILDLTRDELVFKNYRGQLNFDRTWGLNSINAIVGGEIRDLKRESDTYRSYGYNPDLQTSIPVDYAEYYPYVEPTYGSGTIPTNSGFRKTTNRFVSYYANIGYTYDDKYTLSLSGRRDASNLFGVAANDKWTPLWSVGGGWNLSREQFYKSSLFPHLNLRATYGFSGNVSPNLSGVTTLTYLSPSVYTNGQIANVSNFKNSELRWEKVGMLNFGVDFRLKNNILSGSVEYFRKYANDLYGNAPIDRTLGLGRDAITANTAKMRGKGVDVILNSVNLDRAVVWTSNFNFSYYTDKVIELYMSTERADGYVSGSSAAKGYPRYPVFTYKFGGLTADAGNPQGYLNGKLSTNYRALIGDSAKLYDLTYHGSALPTYYGSLGNTISYKGVSLTFRMTYQLGYYFIRKSISYTQLFAQKLGHSDYAERWQQPGDEKKTTIPSMVYPSVSQREFFYQGSDPLATKGDHIRLQYINLGYTFEKAKYRWLPFNNLKAFFVVNNVGIIWAANKYGLDPAYTAPQLPPTRSYSIGITANL